MGLLPYNPNNLGIGGKLLTIAKASATGLPAALSGTGAMSTEIVTFATAHNLKTGDKIAITLGTMVGPVDATTVFAIVLTSTTIKLALTLALSLAGTAINITTDGTATFSYVGTSYRCMNWGPEGKPREVGRTDEVGDDAEFTLRPAPLRQTGVQLQLASNATPAPRGGMEFSDPDDATITYVVMDVSKKFEAGNIWMVEISFRSTGNQTD